MRPTEIAYSGDGTNVVTGLTLELVDGHVAVQGTNTTRPTVLPSASR
jgi:hypothetical protein